MVCVTRRLPLQRLLDLLTPGEEVTVISCNTCTHYCGTGGRLAMDHLTFHLEIHGISVVGKELVTRVCLQEQLRHCSVQGTIVLMACNSGLASVREAWPDKKIVVTNDTLGLGSYHPEAGRATLLFPFPGHECLKGQSFPADDLEVGP